MNAEYFNKIAYKCFNISHDPDKGYLSIERMLIEVLKQIAHDQREADVKAVELQNCAFTRGIYKAIRNAEIE